MQILSLSYSACLCPGDFLETPYSLSSKVTQKRMTPKEVISYKRQLDLLLEKSKNVNNKISIAQFKKSKQSAKQLNKTICGYENFIDTKYNSNIFDTHLCNHSFLQESIQTRRQRISMKVEKEEQDKYTKPCKFLFENKIITRKLPILQNQLINIENNNLSRFKKRLVVEPENRQKVQHKQDYRIAIIPPREEYISVSNYQYGKIHESQRTLPFMKSGYFTTSTERSRQNIILKEAESLYGKLEVTPISKSQAKFPQGFRNAQSLEGNESTSDISFALYHSPVAQRRKQMQSQRTLKGDIIQNLSVIDKRSLGCGSVRDI